MIPVLVDSNGTIFLNHKHGISENIIINILQILKSSFSLYLINENKKKLFLTYQCSILSFEWVVDFRM